MVAVVHISKDIGVQLYVTYFRCTPSLSCNRDTVCTNIAQGHQEQGITVRAPMLSRRTTLWMAEPACTAHRSDHARARVDHECMAVGQHTQQPRDLKTQPGTLGCLGPAFLSLHGGPCCDHV